MLLLFWQSNSSPHLFWSLADLGVLASFFEPHRHIGRIVSTFSMCYVVKIPSGLLFSLDLPYLKIPEGNRHVVVRVKL